MDDFDTRLRTRLTTLEQSVVVRPSARSRRTSWLRRLGVVAGAVVVVGAGAAGATAVGRQVFEAEPAVGLFAPTGLLECSGVWDMTPEEAEAYLADRGYSVVWQIERPDADHPVVKDEPPKQGYIIEGVADGDEITLVVETGPDAIPANVDDC